MTSGVLLCFLLLFWIFLFSQNRREEAQTARMVLRAKANNEKGDRLQMVELAKTMIGKDCVIYTFSSSQTVRCVIQEIRDNALLVATGDGGKGSVSEVINLDFVLRIREIPLKKNGKPRNTIY